MSNLFNFRAFSCKKLLRGTLFAVGFFHLYFSMASSQSYGGATLLYQKNGASADIYLGFSIAGGKDVNGDGKDDFIVGAYKASPSGLTNAGQAFVYSGATGALIYQKNGGQAGDWFGYAVGMMGDINNDGKAEFIVGANRADSGSLGNCGAAFVYSGATGNLLYSKYGWIDGAELGYAVAGAGDVDGDSKPDFIVGAPFGSFQENFTTGAAFVYSGGDGSVIYSKVPPLNGSPCEGIDETYFGYSVAGAGDVDGDGYAEFIIGAPATMVNSNDNCVQTGSAFVYHGSTGFLWCRIDGDTGIINPSLRGDWVGESVGGIGDVNGDGKSDFIIGAGYDDPDGTTDAGSAYVYSSTTGTLQLLYQVKGSAAENHLGQAVMGAGDVNNDGRADFIIGVPGDDPSSKINAGSAHVYSGQNGSVLFSRNGSTAGDQLGRRVANGGNMNSDGFAEFMIGAAFASPSELEDAGSAYVFSPILVDLKVAAPIPGIFELEQNYPNPFNPSTAIRYSILKTNYVLLNIYNTLGQVVRTLVNQEQIPGEYQVVWDGKDEDGQTVSSGVYFYQIRAGDVVQTKKMQLMK